ncbi:MAG: hypothetical protein EOO38_07295 [Cytophagaceae bacterium]|nr:MAG: hypothetical protein EOO38_07295 [Cytophagaceae bacterium]
MSHLRAASDGASQTATERLSAPLWVDIRYALGNARITTFHAADNPTLGLRSGARVSEVSVDGAEYALFAEARKRHASAVREDASLMPATGDASSSPSGWYELLRWGRKLGPDPLPVNAAHWRQIPTPQGLRWADLHAPGTIKCSDADFPVFKGWQCIDDDANHDDQRCDSPRLKTLLLTGVENHRREATLRDRTQLAERLRNTETIQPLMKRLICRFPTEFDRGNIDSRYGWYRDLPGFKENPGSWERLKAHITALTHTDLPQGYKDAQWHFHPAEFIRMFRQCGWLSTFELAQMVPRVPDSTNPLAIIAWQTAMLRWSSANINFDFNRTTRKHGINGHLRQTHFLAQVYIETGLMRLMREVGRGKITPKGWIAPATEYYNTFYGRGLMQLTWPANYAEYKNFKSNITLPDNPSSYSDSDGRIDATSLHYWSDPRVEGKDGQVTIDTTLKRLWWPRYDPTIIADDMHHACESAGFYWSSKIIGGSDAAGRRIGINRVCDQGIGPAVVGRVSVLVNGGSYGYMERQAYAAYIDRIRSDSTSQDMVTEIQSPMGKTSVNHYLERP